MVYNILPSQVVFSDVVTVGAGSSSVIVNEGVSGGVFLGLRSIQATPTDNLKMIVEVDKDTFLNLDMKNLGETPEKELEGAGRTPGKSGCPKAVPPWERSFKA